MPNLHPDEPETQHCKSEGPEQYPATDVPEQAEVCLHTPFPFGVEHGLLVQQRISDEPGHKPDVTVPLQQPAETDTQTPSIPPTLLK